MGVPGYFSRVLRANPAAVSSIPPAACSYLLVDFNCVVHRQVAVGSSADEREAQTAQDVIDKTLAYLANEVVGACKLAANATVLVAADGPPPLAKMMQQRGRRFISRYKCPASAGPPAPAHLRGSDPFNRSDITPGTPFAARLDSAVRELCGALHRSGRFGGGVVYSGTDEPGEGEHKIMRALRGAERTDSSGRPVIYGLDADLLLLSMLHGSRTGAWPVVAREADALGASANGGAGVGLCFVDLQAVCPKIAGGSDKKRVGNHVVCSFLCGNDFLPPLSCLSVQDGWIDKLREMSADLDLAAASASSAASSSSGGLAVDASQLAVLLARLAGREDADFFRADDRYWKARPRVDSASEAWNSHPLINRDETLRSVAPGTPGWRRRFYGRVMGIRHGEDVSRACSEYAAGIAWCAAYYSGGHGALGDEPSWFYPFHYGPASADLANHVALDAGSPGNALLACDAVRYPRFSFSPEAVKNFVVPPEDGDAPRSSDPWAYLFPTGFRLTTYLRHKVWHCAADLPFPLDVSRDVLRLSE